MATKKKITPKKTTKKAAPKKVVKKATVAKKKAAPASKGRIVAKNVITRKSGMLYFINKAGDVLEKALNRKGGKAGRKICK